jgi:hypothetical protein
MTEGCYILKLKKISIPAPENDESLSNAKKLENRFRELGFKVFGYDNTGRLYNKLLLSRPSSSNEKDLDAVLSVLNEISSLYDLYESYHEI